VFASKCLQYFIHTKNSKEILMFTALGINRMRCISLMLSRYFLAVKLWLCFNDTQNMHKTITEENCSFYPRDVISAVCYGDVTGWVTGCLSQPVLCLND